MKQETHQREWHKEHHVEYEDPDCLLCRIPECTWCSGPITGDSVEVEFRDPVFARKFAYVHKACFEKKHGPEKSWAQSLKELVFGCRCWRCNRPLADHAFRMTDNDNCEHYHCIPPGEL